MGVTVSRHTKIKNFHDSNSQNEISSSAEDKQIFYRTLDGTKKGMKIRSGTLKCTWKNDIPVISISKNTIRIKDKENNVIELTGDQDCLELGGFHMTTQCIEEIDGRKGYGLGVDTKLLNLATFEIEVQKDGNIILTGRKLKKSKEGRLHLTTYPCVSPRNVCVDALDDNRKVWIRIYYEMPTPRYVCGSQRDLPGESNSPKNNNNSSESALFPKSEDNNMKKHTISNPEHF